MAGNDTPVEQRIPRPDPWGNVKNINIRGGDYRPLKRPISNNDGESGSISRLQFPANDENTEHFINFIISKKYEFAAREVKDVEARITLPMPQNLQTGYKANYNNDSVGSLGEVFAQGASQSTGTLGNIADTTISQFKNNISGATGMNLLSKFLEAEGTGLATGAIASLFGGNVGAVAGFAAGELASGAIRGSLAGSGVARNPHMATLFSGPDFRTHSFQYKFVPKTIDEQNTVTNIISLMKQAMLPEYIHSDQFFNYPRQFDIQIPLGAEQHNPYFFSIATSVLETFDVNYQPDGPYFHDIDGVKAPVAIAVNMTFREITVTTRDEVKRENR